MQTPLLDFVVPKKLTDDEKKHLLTVIHLDSLCGDSTSKRLYKKLSEIIKLSKTNDCSNQK